MTIYGAVLFFLLSPGVLFRFPSKKPVLVLIVHAVLFTIILQVTYKIVNDFIYKERFELNDGQKIGITIGGALGAAAFIIFIAFIIIKTNIAKRIVQIETSEKKQNRIIQAERERTQLSKKPPNSNM